MSDEEIKSESSPVKTESAAATPDESDIPEAAGGKPSRKTLMQITGETFQYIDKAEKDKSVQGRNVDKTSTILLFLALFFSAVFAFVLVASPESRHLCVALALVSDALFAGAIIYFVLLRFGILRIIEPRFALVCWQLMLGTGVLFAFFTMNIAYIFFTLYKMNGG